MNTKPDLKDLIKSELIKKCNDSVTSFPRIKYGKDFVPTLKTKNLEFGSYKLKLDDLPMSVKHTTVGVDSYIELTGFIMVEEAKEIIEKDW